MQIEAAPPNKTIFLNRDLASCPEHLYYFLHALMQGMDLRWGENGITTAKKNAFDRDTIMTNLIHSM